MSLIPCTAIYGGSAVIEAPPSYRIVEDARWLPRTRYGQAGGLYEPSGRAVIEALSFRGIPNPHTPHGPLWTDQSLERLPLADDSFHYVHVGTINRHYGHFLVGALARLWKLPLVERRRLRLLYDEHYPIADLFAIPYARALLEILNLTPENFVQFRQGARFRRIDVPALAFEENSHIHAVYGELLAYLGSRLVGRPSERHDRLVYLSKERLDGGNWRFNNEAEVTAILRANGVEIVFPETLTFADQVALWREGGLFIGGSSSGLHTSVFAPGSRLVVINNVPKIWSNQVLIDKVSGATSRYVYDPDGLEHQGAGGGFLSNFRIRDPRQFADALLSYAKSLR